MGPQNPKLRQTSKKTNKTNSKKTKLQRGTPVGLYCTALRAGPGKGKCIKTYKKTVHTFPQRELSVNAEKEKIVLNVADHFEGRDALLGQIPRTNHKLKNPNLQAL